MGKMENVSKNATGSYTRSAKRREKGKKGNKQCIAKKTKNHQVEFPIEVSTEFNVKPLL